ncbi:putative mitochondrial chaperone bcs1 [Zopfia rhizophila CBS 207.26]|uniref:Putative mitochondrial chaperone bcs1 n=1 Tax=Zopfia rhizophila CBS 207.26 TaxID=1314779 RepID=A0A6A6DGK4_9PEZI|nr:putative mitochondrial chaperone bcs1 [Zopfia rhizophila CBS 207.26]
MPLLDFFFPGLAPATSSAWPLLTGVPSIYGRLLCICGLLLLFGKYASEYFGKLLETYFTSKIEVPYSDEAYDMLIFWVCSQPFARSARTSLAMVDLKSSRRSNGRESHANKKSLHYSPCNGRSYFWHKRHLFVFERKRNQGELGFTREEACISYFGRNPNVLRELLDECRRYYLGLVKNKTCVFEHEGDRWKPSKSRNKRDMSTVIINKKLKEMLLGDVAEFLDPKTRTWYSTRGLPYQRGYLLYGPPGTGKSSLSLSIAGQFDLDVYVLTMSSLNDHNLKTLFAELPQHCIVLLEDVDATGVHRTQDSKADASQSLGQNGSPRMSANGKVSLSTLLNVLDGLASPEGRVLIMTTNHIERLDPALIRPGRVDMKVEFHLAEEDMISQLFFFVYDPHSKTVISGDDSKEELPQLAQEFVAKVPKLEFSPAEIMSLLLANKQSPRHAIASVDTWMERIREERRKFTRTNSWALDDNDGL